VQQEWGAAERPLGDIASTVYLPSVRDAMPPLSPLVVLTSGLYPGHSAQYNRVEVGGRRWQKIGHTTGWGSFHISGPTMEAMARFNEAADGYRHITRDFGEGSGARFRMAGRALERLGLPDLRRHETRRPLYVLPLVDDPQGALLGWSSRSRDVAPEVNRIATEWWPRWVEPRAPELVLGAIEAADLRDATTSLLEALDT
jgi:hypothetical protein